MIKCYLFIMFIIYFITAFNTWRKKTNINKLKIADKELQNLLNNTDKKFFVWFIALVQSLPLAIVSFNYVLFYSVNPIAAVIVGTLSIAVRLYCTIDSLKSLNECLNTPNPFENWGKRSVNTQMLMLNILCVDTYVLLYTFLHI